MSGELDDPVEILSDDGSDNTQTDTNITTKKGTSKEASSIKSAKTPSKGGASNKNTDMANVKDPEPSTSKDEDDKADQVNGDNQDDDIEDDNPSEYNVEAIRAKRKNRHGVDEYYIKWEGYPEDENTWEPLENLKCPELISRFNEQEANKRRKKKAERLGATQASATKRPRREAAASTSGAASQINDNNDDTESLFIEGDDEENDYHTEHTRKKTKGNHNKDSNQTNLPAAPRGFDRNLPVEKIVTASVGDDDKLYFFLKWQGRNEMELVDADDLEKKCPYALCRWYRDRLYWESSEHERQLETTNAH